MTLIDNLNNFSFQESGLILPDGTEATLGLKYNAAAQRWIASVSYGGVTINGINLCTHPNFIRQWRNVLPFGLACITADGTDPFDINDFSSGRVQMYLLSAADVAQAEAQIFGVPA